MVVLIFHLLGIINMLAFVVSITSSPILGILNLAVAIHIANTIQRTKASDAAKDK